MNINFELYKVFYYVAKTLSFSEASENLFISQSAVSQSIKQLEERLDCKLFFRNTKKVKLTVEGKELFQHIEQAFNFIKSGERIISETHSLKIGEIRIGASDTICTYDLLPYFKEFKKAYPNIKLNIINRTSPECIALLKKGSVDFSVVNIPDDFQSDELTVSPFKTLQDVFIASSEFSFLKNKTIHISELKNYPILVLEKNTTTRQHFDKFLSQNKIKLVPEVELGSIELLKCMAKEGFGISLVIKNYLEKELLDNDIFIIDTFEKIPERNIGILTHKSMPIPIAAKKMIEMITEKK